MRCVKRGGDAEHQYRWWMSVPQEVRPPRLVWDDEADEVSYDFVEGIHPRDWETVAGWAQETLWGMQVRPGGSTPVAPPPVDPAEYMDYVEERAAAAERLGLRLPRLTGILNVLGRSQYTPVRTCHGDLTLKNCVVSIDGRFTFLDPGHSRGLPCREIDEAKIMQSLDGFDVVYRGHDAPTLVPRFPARPVHWALLATHYIRLMTHVTWDPALHFASHRVFAIEELLK